MTENKEAAVKIPFTKMHGCGNDYIYINGFCTAIPQARKPELARSLSDRHFGIGGDGLIFINPCQEADFEMEMYNADGSRSEMCGNGIRCVAKYAHDRGLTAQKRFSVLSGGQIKYVELTVENGETKTVRVDMGKPCLTPDLIPVEAAGERVVDEPILVGQKEYRMTCVSMGNPHCVVFGEDPDGLDLEKLGPMFEHHPAFPERVNTEFVQVLGKNELKMRVWERGSGETWACGTGACAVAVAAVLNGYAEKDADILVHLKGGDLWICYRGDKVLMSGAAELAFVGTVEI